jgi:hypothetical protein
MKAVATGMGANRDALMALPKISPRMARGRKAMKRLSTRRLASGCRPRPEKVRITRSRYSQTTARMAPDWMTISNSLPRSSLKLSRSPARIRCPVLEIGRNSVKPSTTPRISAFRSRMMSMNY